MFSHFSSVVFYYWKACAVYFNYKVIGWNTSYQFAIKTDKGYDNEVLMALIIGFMLSDHDTLCSKDYQCNKGNASCWRT